jgi:hypothetical protein
MTLRRNGRSVQETGSIGGGQSLFSQPIESSRSMKTSFPLNSRKVGPDNKERVAGARDLRIAGVSRDSTVQYPKSELGNKVAKETRDERQFRRFLEAAATLGSHLTDTFDDVFLKVVPAVRGEVSPGAATPLAASSRLSWGNVTPIENASSLHSRDKMSSAAPSDDFMRPSSAASDASIIVRLHFAEAMMVLLFNSLDDKQQSSVKDGFGRLLAEVENLEKLGMPPDTIQAYRDALSAMRQMLASNPEPEELAVALGDDFPEDFADEFALVLGNDPGR